jgi:hypothetical protein
VKSYDMGADGFTSPTKNDVLRMFIDLNNSLFSSGFEPKNLESNGKHDNHQTTENNIDALQTLLPNIL